MTQALEGEHSRAALTKYRQRDRQSACRHHIGGMMNTAELQNIEVDGVDTGDYPDLCDAYISYAEHSDGTPLSEEELDALNEDGDFVHEQAHESLL